MQNVTVVGHPLVQHKLTLMRDIKRSTKGFRQLLNEIGMLLCYEVTRDLVLSSLKPILYALVGNQVHAVVVAAHHVTRDIVGDDPVGAFRLPFRKRLFDDLVSFRGKSDEEPRALLAQPKLGQDVASGHEVQLRRAISLLELRRRRLDAPIRDGCNEDRRVDRKRGKDGVGHLLGRFDIDASDSWWSFESHRARDYGHPCAGLGSRCGNCKSMSARRAIGDHPHRINRLMCRPGSDEDMLVGEAHLEARNCF